ncbi:hypothetical protein [Endozoicomonas sp. SESOKO2]|uniref:hypothetical protein n=1 Tax=Endozoicomonas sp. SESOKO2 TaxID=2828743 RepID=UPI00214874AF|nr:hypothetical protein [Endozoicomonas sp. SESOKO2]
MPPGIQNQRGSSLSATERKKIATASEASSLGQIDYGRWRGRMVSVFSGIGGFIKRLFGGGSSSAKALRVYDSFRYAAHAEFSSPIQRSLRDYHIACAMAYHDVCVLGEEKKGEEMKLVLSGGREKISEQVLNEVRKTVSSSTVELTYKYLAEDRALPVGFLKRALLPDLIQSTAKDFNVDAVTAEATVAKLAQDAGLLDDTDITFERILEIKNALRWRFAPETHIPVKQVMARKGRDPVSGFDASNPAATPPGLDRPKATRYHLDEVDRTHIQNVVDKGGGIKLKNTDTRDRIKRHFLRNKRYFSLNSAAIVVSTVLIGLVSGGIAAAAALFSYIAWYGAWSGGTELIRMTKAIRALQRAEASADYKLEMNDLGVLSEMDDKKFRVFLKSLRYICSHETLTRIFNAYSALEKDAQLRLEMEREKDESNLEAVIRLEEGKARYLYRRRNLQDAFKLYKRLYTAAVSDVERMDQEWEPVLDQLWNCKFKNMDPEKRERLFSDAANDPRVIGKSYHFKTKQTGWLQKVFPKMTDDLTSDGSISSKEAVEELERVLKEEMPDLELTEEERSRFNTHANRVANALILAENGVRSYLNVWLKGAIKSTMLHGFKVVWHASESVPKLEISPYLPRPTVDGLIIFGFFFLADLFVNRYNEAINKERFERIIGKKTGKSVVWDWQGQEARTGREEMGTMRRLAKDQLEDFVDRILKLHESHKDVMKEVRLQEQLAQVNPNSPMFDHMDDREAAVLILRRQYHHQIISEMMVGAIGKYYESVMTKTAFWDQQMSYLIPPQTSI